MPLPRPEQDLRRLVARLAAASTEDIDEVIAQLDDDGRARILDLLASYRTPRAAPAAAQPARQALDTDGLSGWLGARVQAAQTGGGGEMTATAAQALCDAVRLTQGPRLEPAGPPPATWLSRLARVTAGARR